MEHQRISIDTGERCPDCGAPAAVYEHADELMETWIVELRECSNGCTEITETLRRSTPAAKPRSRRRHVA